MMMVIVSYDVNTETASGKKRLRNVSKYVTTMAKEFKIQYLSVL